jgi:hypothetical protein
MLQFCQKCSSSVVCKSLVIPKSPKGLYFLRLFSSRDNNGEVSDEKRVRRWVPRDHLLVNENTSERLYNPLPQETKPLEPKVKKLYNGYGKQRVENTYKTKDLQFETQLEVDTYIQSSLQSSNNKSISNLLRISAKVSKRNKRVSFLKNHLPAIVTQLKELSSSTWTFQEISGVVYGLQYMTVNEAGVRDILSVMTTIAAKSITNVTLTQSLQGQHIGMCLYGLQSMSSKDDSVRGLLSIVTMMIAGCSVPLKAQEVGNALYGLKGMSSDFSEVRDLLSALSIKIRLSKEELSAQAVGNALYGLKGMSSDRSEVRDVLAALFSKVCCCEEDLKAQELGNALYGLQNMSSDCSEVCDMISVLTVKIRSCKENLKGQEVGNALYGLKNMSSDQGKVRELLFALAVKIRSRKDDLKSQEVGNALYGLQNMSNDCIEVRTMLSALSMKVHSCKEDLSAQEVGNALYGLKGMSSDCIEVRDLLSALTIKVRNCKEVLSAQAVGNALYGLQGMSSDCSEVRNMISALSLKVHGCEEHLSAQAVGNALSGMQGVVWIGDSPYYISLISFMSRQINILVDNISSTDSFKGTSGIETTDLVTLCQSLTFFLSKISSLIDKKVHKNLEKMNASIINELIWRRKHGDKYFNGMEGIQSKEARRVYDIALSIFQDNSIDVDRNVLLFDLFESDLILHVTFRSKGKNPGQTETIINIEIDGIFSKNKKKLMFCRRKDECLKSKGVFVFRIDASQVEEMKEKELKKWLVKRIQEVKEQTQLLMIT